MKKNHKLILLAIILFGLFLRLFKLQELFYFSMDEAYIAFRAWGLFKLQRPFLIGAAGPIQLHLPPYFFYLSSFLLAPFKFNPVGWGIWSALIGGATIYLTFQLTKKAFNFKTALIASLLYTVSFTTVFFDRHYWPLNLNPLYSLTVLLLLFKLNKKNIIYYLLLAIILVLAVSSDPSNLTLVLLSFIYLYQHRTQLKLKFINLFTATSAFLFAAPLVLFDLRHHGQNIAGLTRFFQRTSAYQFQLSKLINALLLLPRSLVRFWYSPQTNLIQLYSYCIPYASARQKNLPFWLLLLAIAILIWFIKASKTSIEKIISQLILLFLFGITLFGILGYSIFDHYLAGLLPVFAVLTAKFLSKLPKLFALITVIIFLVFNLYQISKAHNPYGLKFKQNLVAWANQQLQNQDFSLESISKCHKENGLRYLFELTDNPPQQSFMDPNFAWLYRQPPAKVKPAKTLLVTDKPLETDLTTINQQSFGALKAYILNNFNLSSVGQ